MILISVKSEIMDCKRQYESDKDAEMFLKRVKRIHSLSRVQSLRNINPFFTMPNRRGWVVDKLKAKYTRALSASIPLKIEIINTKANQLNLNLR